MIVSAKRKLKDPIAEYQVFRKQVNRYFGADDEKCKNLSITRVNSADRSIVFGISRVKSADRSIVSSPVGKTINESNLKYQNFKERIKLQQEIINIAVPDGGSHWKSRFPDTHGFPDTHVKSRFTDTHGKSRFTSSDQSLQATPPKYKEWSDSHTRSTKEPHITDQILSYSHVHQLLAELTKLRDDQVRDVPHVYIQQLMDLSRLIENRFGLIVYCE